RVLEGQSPLDKELARLGADIALGNRDLKRAVALARQAVPAASRDYRDQLWLAHVLWTAGQPAEAEETLRGAVKTAPSNPDVWVALVRHLARTGQHGEAEAVLEEARQKLPKDRVPLTMARGYEALGQLDRSEQVYLDLLKQRPDDFIALASLADF